MKILFILLFGCMKLFAEGSAFEVNYDKVFIYRLSHPQKISGLISVDDFSKNKNDIFLDKSSVSSKLFKKIDRLFANPKKFNNGLNDINLQVYSMVFLRNGQVVLTITPNVLGNDLYISKKLPVDFEPSLSKKQLSEFLDICFLSYALDRRR
jgi:hypothetical protein